MAPIKETIFGTPMVIFRTESGQVAALHDRCPHRFAPFSMGMVVGENIECPYHGLQFGTDGGCALNPHGDYKIPQAARVQSFPVAERDGVIWIWPVARRSGSGCPGASVTSQTVTRSLSITGADCLSDLAKCQQYDSKPFPMRVHYIFLCLRFLGADLNL